MRFSPVLVGIIFFSITGCIRHYHEISGDMIHFYLKDSKAEKVFLATSLDGYQMHPAMLTESRTWKVSIPEKRRFKYFYIIDNRVFIPQCKYQEKDDFGGFTCIYLSDNL